MSVAFSERYSDADELFVNKSSPLFISCIERMVLMNSNKSKGAIKILTVGLAAAVISFTLTGVAENVVSGALRGDDIAYGLKRLTVLSAALAMPINEFDKNESTQTYDTVSQDKPETSDEGNSSVSSIEQTTQTESKSTAKPSTASTAGTAGTASTVSTPSATESEPTESLVPALAPVESKTGLISLNIRKDKDDLTSYTAKDGVTEEKHYGKITGDNVVELEHGQVRNCTEMPSNILLTEGTRKPGIKIEGGSDPQVLIIHTHTTESYERDSDGYYDTSYSGRSLCPANSVVGVGAVLAQTLADNGISTIHDGTVFDDPIYNYSYSRSRERIEEILKEYPSIKVVLDIHRDGIADGDVRIAPIAEIDGKKAAQIMIICGCDDGTGILPDYIYNLRFATYLQNGIEADNAGLTRPMLFDYRFYNQDLTRGSLVIEFGALANDISQVRYSAELAGKSIARLLTELM